MLKRASLGVTAAAVSFGVGALAQTGAPRGAALENLTWAAAQPLLSSSTVVVIPMGAAAEDHGAILPMDTDARLAGYLAQRVEAAASVVIAPPLTYQYYPAAGYPGTTKLPLMVARDTTLGVVRTLARYGPRRFYILNTGVTASRALRDTAALLSDEGILVRTPGHEWSHAEETEIAALQYIEGTSPVGGEGVESLVAGILQEIEQLRTTPLPQPRSAVVGGTTAPGGPPGPNGCTPGDEREIRNIGLRYSFAWRNMDVDTLSQMFTPDGDMRHPDGTIERGRDNIRANRIELFKQRAYRGSQHVVTLSDIRCVGPDVAIADGKWELRDLVDDKGNRSSFSGLCTLVVRRVGGWAIEAWRYTITPPNVPVGPTILKQPGWPGKDK